MYGGKKMVKKKKQNKKAVYWELVNIGLISGCAGIGCWYTSYHFDLGMLFAFGFSGLIGCMLTILLAGKRKAK